MRKISNYSDTVITFVLSNILLPIIIVLGVTVFLDPIKVAVSSDVDLMSIINRARDNKSIMQIATDTIASMQLMVMSYVGYVSRVNGLSLLETIVVDFECKKSKKIKEKKWGLSLTFKKISGGGNLP